MTQKLEIRLTGKDDIDGYAEMILGMFTLTGALRSQKMTKKERRFVTQIYMNLELAAPPLGHLGTADMPDETDADIDGGTGSYLESETPVADIQHDLEMSISDYQRGRVDLGHVREMYAIYEQVCQATGAKPYSLNTIMRDDFEGWDV